MNRYEKNLGTIGADGQKKLSGSRVAVIGCGGLGGWAAELLARAGVGELVLVDGDIFAESNLNRQLFCTEKNIGQSKVKAAAERVRLINSCVDVRPFNAFLDDNNAHSILNGCDIAIDALDSFASRVVLCRAAEKLNIKIIHGAIAGWWGQVAVIEPGDKSFVSVWESHTDEKGLESQVGNPPFTPSIVASIQVAEAIKCLLGKPALKALLYIDLLEQTYERIGV